MPIPGIAGIAGLGGVGAAALPAGYISHTVATNSITPTYPASIAAGNFLVGVCIDNAAAATFGAPAGWTLVGSVTTTSVKIYVFFKLADGSESGTCTFTRVGGGTSGAFIVRYGSGSGVEGVATNATTNDSITPIVSPSVTTTVANALIVNVFGQGQNQTLTPEAGWTERFDQGANLSGANDYICALHEKPAVGIGAQATETPTPAATGFPRAVISFAIKP